VSLSESFDAASEPIHFRQVSSDTLPSLSCGIGIRDRNSSQVETVRQASPSVAERSSGNHAMAVDLAAVVGGSGDRKSTRIGS
jgi:hypothetical protein